MNGRDYGQNTHNTRLNGNYGRLWYYIQCDRLNLRIEHKYLIKIRKYKDNPEQCLDHACPKKYNFVPGTILTRYFKGIKYTILVNDDCSFSYNGDKYSTLSAVATKIAGMKMSGKEQVTITNLFDIAAANQF